MKIMATSFISSCAAALSAPDPEEGHLPTHSSAGNSWKLTAKSASVYFGVTAPFSVLVHTRYFLCPERVCFPSSV